MIKINTHQSSNGRWYASTTYKGYDYFEEGRTIEEAQENMAIYLNSRGVNKNMLQFTEPKLYPVMVNNTQKIGLQKRPIGIDNNPIG